MLLCPPQGEQVIFPAPLHVLQVTFPPLHLVQGFCPLPEHDPHFFLTTRFDLVLLLSALTVSNVSTFFPSPPQLEHRIFFDPLHLSQSTRFAPPQP